MKLYPFLPLIFIAAYIFVGTSIAFNTPNLALIGTSVFVVFLLIYFLIMNIKKNNHVSAE
jgi:basic amino acid/polyamine antiporter, APA family